MAEAEGKKVRQKTNNTGHFGCGNQNVLFMLIILKTQVIEYSKTLVDPEQRKTDKLKVPEIFSLHFQNCQDKAVIFP